MKQIMLNDILHLTDEEIKRSKIGLNMSWGGKSHFERWYESDNEHRDTDFNYHSHQGGKRNFTYVGQMCFGFVRLVGNIDSWLLISAGEITSIPENEGVCEHKEIEKYQGLIGRLVIKFHKGNTFSRYIFKTEGIIDKVEVKEILPNIYEPIKFEGYDHVHLEFSTLKHILEGSKYATYKAFLKEVKGIYCLTDIKTEKCYIGSASGDNGILQRWNNYINNQTGGNQALIELYNEKGEQYFKDNFKFTIIETFNKNVDSKCILDREKYWKDVFRTKANGYNRN